MSNQVRVTLEKPYAFTPMGGEAPLILRYGTSDARVVSVSGSISIGGAQYDGDDLVDAGSHADRVPRQLPRVIPGKPIVWTLLSSDEEMNGLIVPAEAARLWFGDWRLPKEAAPGTPTEDTYGFERNRVAQRWGWWQMPRMSSSGLTHLRRGEDAPDTTKIGPPAIPHVLIEDVNAQGRSTGKLQFRPWDHFRWQDDVISPIALDTRGPSPTIQGYTASELRAILAEIEAREASKAGGKGAK